MNTQNDNLGAVPQGGAEVNVVASQSQPVTSETTQAVVWRPGHEEPVLADMATPSPGEGQVLVAVAAASINPADRMVASSPEARAAFGITDEVGIGWDVSGVVEQVGPGVTSFAPGDRVAAMHPDLSAPARGQAERVVLDATWVAPLPVGLDLVDAASIPLNSLTAQQALDVLDAGAASGRDGRRLLITGAGGGVGGYAVALAHAVGWEVTAWARQQDADFVRSAGAVAITQNPQAASFDAVFDPAVLGASAMTAVRDGGQYVGVMPPKPAVAERNIRSHEVMVGPDAHAQRELLRRSASGELAVRVAGRLPLAEAPKAYQSNAEPGQRGRWLLLGPVAN